MGATKADEASPLSFSGTTFEARNLFPTAVFIAPINEAEEINPGLTRTILERAGAEPSVVKSNRGGWQSETDFMRWSGPEGARLITAAQALAAGLTGIQDDAGLHRAAPDWRMHAWANINRSGDFNTGHHHPGAFWSGVYWIDAGEEPTRAVGGEFEIFDPRGVLPAFYAPSLRIAAPGQLSAGASEFISPRTGTLILFPSWLVHAVRPYVGARPRISVAFNLSV